MHLSFTPMLRDCLADGATFEEGIRSLREAGATPIDTIKAIREVKETDLGTAKQLFTQSPAWKDVTDAAQAFHQELLDAVEADQKEDAEHAVAPNRSLPSTLNSTSSVRGSEDL